jgi:hypothetical protein
MAAIVVTTAPHLRLPISQEFIFLSLPNVIPLHAIIRRQSDGKMPGYPLSRRCQYGLYTTESIQTKSTRAQKAAPKFSDHDRATSEADARALWAALAMDLSADNAACMRSTSASSFEFSASIS